MFATLISLLVLGWLVIVHELGHLVVARWAGVRVLRFSMGFGPRLLTWKRGHTEYAVSAIPLGGYVKMAGEQRGEQSHLPAAPDSAPASAAQAGQPWEYLSKPIGVRAAIVFAGPFVNYLVALVTLWTVYIIGFPELLPVVGKVIDDMPAKVAGFQVNDRIEAVDGQSVRTWEEMTKLIYAAPERPLTFQLIRSRTSQTLTVTPKPKTITDPFGQQKTVGLIGISPSGEFQPYRVGPIAAIGRTIRQQNEWIGQTMLGLWSLATGKMPLRDSVTGPMGIVFLTSEAVHLGIAPLLFLVSLFSLSLALFNVFPIPILDGGHLLFLALEKLRGRPVSITIQERSAQVSLVLLMTLLVLVCVNDVSRFGLVDKVVDWVRR